MLRIALDAPPQLSLQLFCASVEFASGRENGGQLNDDGLSFPIDARDPPVRARFFLPVFDLRGDQVAIDAVKGYSLRLRFEPNDLGKVDFRGTSLRIDDSDLVLERYGRDIRFHRTAAP